MGSCAYKKQMLNKTTASPKSHPCVHQRFWILWGCFISLSASTDACEPLGTEPYAERKAHSLKADCEKKTVGAQFWDSVAFVVLLCACLFFKYKFLTFLPTAASGLAVSEDKKNSRKLCAFQYQLFISTDPEKRRQRAKRIARGFLSISA